MSDYRKKNIALVIGSGGVMCAAAIGMWRIFRDEGITFDRIVGCSGGSLYAASIALDMGVAEMEALSTRLWTTDIMRGYTTNLKASKDGSLRFNERSGLVDDSVLNENLKQVYGSLSFSDLPVPLTIVATDLIAGEKVMLSEGNLLDAIRASLPVN